jgi:hypothetical protein
MTLIGYLGAVESFVIELIPILLQKLQKFKKDPEESRIVAGVTAVLQGHEPGNK